MDGTVTQYLSDAEMDNLEKGTPKYLSDADMDALEKEHPTKRNTTYGEDFQIGLGNAASTAIKGIGLIAGAVPGYLGFEDARDKVYDKTLELAKETQDYWTPKDAEQTFGGKLAGMVSTFPAQLVAMPFAPAETGMTMIDNGESVSKAQMGTLIDTLGNEVGLAAPGAFGTKLITKMATGAGINAAQDYITRKAISDISDTEANKKQFAPTAETTGLAAAMGAGFGMLHSDTPTVKSGDPYKDKGKSGETPDNRYSEFKADLERQLDVRVSREQSILDQLARQQDPNSEYAQQLHKDLLTTRNEMIQLQTELGKSEIKAATTEPEVMDEQVSPTVETKPVGKTTLDRISLLNQLESFVSSIRQTDPDPFLEQYFNSIEDTDRGVARYVEKYFDQLPEKLKEQLQGENVRDLETGELLNALTDSVRGGHIGQLRRLRDEVLDGHHGTIPEQKNGFVSGRTIDEVHEMHNGRDISEFSTKILQNMYDNKMRKIDEARERVLDYGLGTPEGQKALHFMDVLKKEANDIYSYLEKRTDYNAAKDVQGDDASVPHEGIASKLSDGDIRGALDEVRKLASDPKAEPTMRSLGILVDKLLSNPFIGLGRFKWAADLKHGAGYDNATGEILTRSSLDATPRNVVHEVVHSAVNKVLEMFKNGMDLPFQQKQAARVLNDLHQKLLNNPEFIKKIDAFVGKDNREIMLADVKELVAHGTTDPYLQAALQSIKLGGQSVFSKLGNAIKNVLGFNDRTSRTAFDELMLSAERLIDSSDGKAPGEAGISYAQRHTPSGIMSAVRSGATWVFAHGFTANLPQLMRFNPHFTAFSKIIDQAAHRQESLLRSINYGKTAFEVYKRMGKYFYTLKGAEDDGAVVPALRKVGNEHISDVMDTMMDGYRKGVDAEETISKQSGWTPEQTNLAKAINNGVIKLAEEVFRMYGRTDLPQRLKQRVGYMLTTRSGRHGVLVSWKGIDLRYETYLTEREARQREAWFRKNAPEATVKYELKDEKDGARNIAEYLETLKNVPDNDLRDHLERELDRMTTENAAIGNHTMKSSILSGFAGDQAGMSKHDKGKLLRDAIPRAFTQYTQNIMSREIQKRLVDFKIDNDHKMSKDTSDLIDFYTQSQIGTPYNKDATVRNALHDVSTGIRENISTAADAIFGTKFRDKHALDRFMGLFGNVFYTANITMKPAIWIAQPLQALTTVRSSFKEGQTPKMVLQALGETIKTLSLQKLGNDPDFMEALYHVSQDGNTLHPQMVNEFNDWKIGKDPNSTLNKTIDLLTGRTISAAGDKASRFASFTFMYHLHKANGLRGKELWEKAAADTTENMIAYGNKKLPAIYREMGIFGEQAAPLATFAHGQLANLIVDTKEFFQKPGARTAAPLILTGAVMMALGGAISLPILAEYELVRRGAIAAGFITEEAWPSATSLVLDHTPWWVSHGVLSASTGIDMDASMRYTSLLAKLSDVEQQGIFAFLPPLAWAKDAIKGGLTIGTDLLGVSHTQAEMDQAIKKTVPKGWVGGVVDQARNNWDLIKGDDKNHLFTRFGKNSEGGVRRTTAEKIAPFIGSRSLKEAGDSAKLLDKKRLDKQRDELYNTAAQYLYEGNSGKAKQIMQKLITEYKEDPSTIGDKVQTLATNRNTEALTREYYGAEGNPTPKQQATVVRDNLGEYIKKRKQLDNR